MTESGTSPPPGAILDSGSAIQPRQHSAAPAGRLLSGLVSVQCHHSSDLICLAPRCPANPLTQFTNLCIACLASGEAAQLNSGDIVLDVGVGYADQTAVWAQHFGVARVVAIERSESHVVAARRAQANGMLAGGDIVDVRVGTATALPADVAGLHSAFDAVLCLDCAYHFDTRAAFLGAAGSLLRPGGRFAAVDLLVAEDDEEEGERPRLGSTWRLIRRRARACWRWGLRRAVAAMTDIPAANLYDVGSYAELLQASNIGDDVNVVELTDQVLAPFAAHARAQRLALGSAISVGERAFLWLIAALFALVARHQLFSVVLITARKPTARR